MLRFSVLLSVALLATLFAATFISASAVAVSYETATRCLFDKSRRSRSVHALPAHRRALFDQLLALAIKRHGASEPRWFDKPELSCAAGQRQDPPNAVGDALLFLVQFCPEQDTKLPLELFLDTVTFALTARTLFAFASDKFVPWGEFLNNVLPYSVLSENRDPWRPLFFRYFTGGSRGAALRNMSSPAAAASWMNAYAYDMPPPGQETAPRIEYFECASDGICSYSPFETLRARNASCTGLSIFLVAAQRSVGLPSRIAGTPHWNLGPKRCPHGDASDDCGDHSWTEVNVGGGWSFQDSDATPTLNQSWFVPLWTEHQVPVAPHSTFLNHSIFASSFAPSDFVVSEWGGDADPLAQPQPFYPMVWNWTTTAPPSVAKISSAWDVTRRYLTFDPKKRRV